MFLKSAGKSLSLTLLLTLCLLVASGGHALAQSAQDAHSAKKGYVTNDLPVIHLEASAAEVRLPASCRGGSFPKPGWQPTDTKVLLMTDARDPNGDALTFHYTATDGRITGTGAGAIWDLAGLAPGVYRATAFAVDGKGREVCSWVMVRVTPGECVACGTVKTDGPLDLVQPGEVAQLRAGTQNAAGNALSYQWSVSAGRIVGGQGTPFLNVDTTGLSGQSVTATVSVGGLGASCPNSDTHTFTVAKKLVPVMIDRFTFTSMDDAKARLDLFAAQMQQTPDATAVMVVYGTCAGAAMRQALRQQDYLVNQRGLDTAHIRLADGGCRPQMQTELWVVPNGAPLPALPAQPASCQPCRVGRR